MLRRVTDDRQQDHADEDVVPSQLSGHVLCGSDQQLGD